MTNCVAISVKETAASQLGARMCSKGNGRQEKNTTAIVAVTASTDHNAIDRTLLRLLQEDGRRTTLELAERVGLSSTGTSQRVKRLFREGYVKAVRAILDPKKIGRGTVVFIHP